MARLSFNVAATDPASGSDLLPGGMYIFRIEKVETGPTQRDPDSERVACTFTAVKPDGMKGRKMFVGFNTRNSNPQAERIGQSELAALAAAVGIRETMQDDQELVGKFFLARVGVRPQKKDAAGNVISEEQNNIKKYAPANQWDEATMNVAVVEHAPTAGAAPNVPAWAAAAPAPAAVPPFAAPAPAAAPAVAAPPPPPPAPAKMPWEK